MARIIDRALVRTEGMRKLIVDLLDLTRIESGQKRRELVAADLREVARAAIETVAPAAAARGIAIEPAGAGARRRSSPIAASSTSSSTTSSATP